MIAVSDCHGTHIRTQSQAGTTQRFRSWWRITGPTHATARSAWWSFWSGQGHCITAMVVATAQDARLLDGVSDDGDQAAEILIAVVVLPAVRKTANDLQVAGRVVPVAVNAVQGAEQLRIILDAMVL